MLKMAVLCLNSFNCLIFSNKHLSLLMLKKKKKKSQQALLQLCSNPGDSQRGMFLTFKLERRYCKLCRGACNNRLKHYVSWI